MRVLLSGNLGAVQGLGIEVDLSLPAKRVKRSLNQIIEWRGKPRKIRCGNGPEYVSGALKCWAEKQGIEPYYSTLTYSMVYRLNIEYVT